MQALQGRYSFFQRFCRTLGKRISPPFDSYQPHHCDFVEVATGENCQIDFNLGPNHYLNQSFLPPSINIIYRRRDK